MRFRLLGILIVMVCGAFTASAYATTYDFNNGTAQGWTYAGLYDDGGFTQVPGYFATGPAFWGDGQNSPGAPPAYDPLGNNIGSVAIGSGGFNTPDSPSGSAFLHWDLVSPALGGDAQWQGISSFTYDVAPVMASTGGDNYVQAILRVQLPDMSQTFYTDAVFHQMALNQSYNQINWTTYSVDVAALGLPAGSTLLGVDFRVFFDSGAVGYDGYILFDNITPVGAAVPEPATMLLIGTGLAGLAGFRRRFKK